MTYDQIEKQMKGWGLLSNQEETDYYKKITNMLFFQKNDEEKEFFNDYLNIIKLGLLPEKVKEYALKLPLRRKILLVDTYFTILNSGKMLMGGIQ